MGKNRTLLREKCFTIVLILIVHSMTISPIVLAIRGVFGGRGDYAKDGLTLNVDGHFFIYYFFFRAYCVWLMQKEKK